MANIDATSGLILKRSNRSDSYDVYLDGRIVGGIDEITSHFGNDAPWFWGFRWEERRGDGPHQGEVATREEAMAAFRAAWDAQQSAEA